MKTFLTVFIFLMSVNALVAQQNAWVGFDFGLIDESHASAKFWSKNFNFHYQYNKHLFGIRITEGEDNDPGKGEYWADYREISFLYGTSFYFRWLRISAMGGMGYIESNFDGYGKNDYEKYTIKTIGLPVEVKLLITPIKFVGLGFGFHAFLSTKRSYPGVELSLNIGKLVE
jgi:hypothetical protein